MGRSDMMIDDLSPLEKKRYFHHYNFPPFSTGETGFMRGPKRRGSVTVRSPSVRSPRSSRASRNGLHRPHRLRGHGLERFVLDGFGLWLDPVADGRRCADQGAGRRYRHGSRARRRRVRHPHRHPRGRGCVRRHGLQGRRYHRLHHALQLDTKIAGIPANVLAGALSQAREARLDILDIMLEAIPAPRGVRETAPKIVSFEIPIDKIGEVIGPKGKVINTIQGETGADISVDDDGMVGIVAISSTDNAKVAEAKRQIELILDPPTAEVGAEVRRPCREHHQVRCVREHPSSRDGLLHISKIGGGKRIDKVEDVLELGQEVQVVVEDVDPNGKISLKPVGDGPEATGGDAPKHPTTPLPKRPVTVNRSRSSPPSTPTSPTSSVISVPRPASLRRRWWWPWPRPWWCGRR